jgi:transposase InsO family protein
VAIDNLTKWVEVAAVPEPSTSQVIPFIQCNIIHRHSQPKRLVGDHGAACSSREFDAKLTEWRIDHIPATPEHPQTNGLCERLNETVSNRNFPFKMVDGKHPMMAQDNKLPWPPDLTSRTL